MGSLCGLLYEVLSLVLEEFHVVDFPVKFAGILADEGIAFPFLYSSDWAAAAEEGRVAHLLLWSWTPEEGLYRLHYIEGLQPMIIARSWRLCIKLSRRRDCRLQSGTVLIPRKRTALLDVLLTG